MTALSLIITSLEQILSSSSSSLWTGAFSGSSIGLWEFGTMMCSQCILVMLIQVGLVFLQIWPQMFWFGKVRLLISLWWQRREKGQSVSVSKLSLHSWELRRSLGQSSTGEPSCSRWDSTSALVWSTTLSATSVRDSPTPTSSCRSGHAVLLSLWNMLMLTLAKLRIDHDVEYLQHGLAEPSQWAVLLLTGVVSALPRLELESWIQSPLLSTDYSSRPLPSSQWSSPGCSAERWRTAFTQRRWREQWSRGKRGGGAGTQGGHIPHFPIHKAVPVLLNSSI